MPPTAPTQPATVTRHAAGATASPPREVVPIAHGLEYDTGINTAMECYRQRFWEAAAKVTVELRLVTPAWAAEVLRTKNTKNRPMHSGWKRVKDSVLDGRWEVNGETVVFDEDGVLADGQGRLRGIAEGGEAVPTLVVYGVTRRAFETIDQSKRRSASDVLAVSGEKNYTQLAAALNWLHRYDTGRMRNGTREGIDNEHVVAVAARYPGVDDDVTWANSRVKRGTLPTPAAVACLRHKFRAIDPALTEEFLTAVVDRVGIARNSHEHVLVRRLDKMAEESRNNDVVAEAMALTVKTWNSIRRGDQPREFIAWRGDEEFPAIR